MPSKPYKYIDGYTERLNPKRRLKLLLGGAKHRALVKNLEFDIDYDYIQELWNKTDGHCYLTGQKFDLENWGSKRQVNPRAPSIDRIIPALGYVKGNVRLITYHMNVALTDFGVEEFQNLIERYKEHMNA